MLRFEALQYLKNGPSTSDRVPDKPQIAFYDTRYVNDEDEILLQSHLM